MLKVHHISSDCTFLNFSFHLLNTLQQWSFLNAPQSVILLLFHHFVIRRKNQKNQLITVIKHVCCGADTSQKPVCVLEARTATATVLSVVSFSGTRGAFDPVLSPRRGCIGARLSACACLSPASLRAFLLCFPSQELPGLHAHEVDSV